MRFLAGLVVFILELIVLAIAISAILAGLGTFSPDPLGELFSGLVPTGEGATRLYWAALALLPLLHWVLAIAVMRRRKTIIFKTSPTESLSINKRAIIDTIKDELNSVPAVVSHKVDVEQVGPLAVDVMLDLKVRPIENIPMLQARLAKSIRRTLSDILGIDNIRKIKIDVGRISGAKKKKRSEVPVSRRLGGPRQESGSRGLDAPKEAAAAGTAGAASAGAANEVGGVDVSEQAEAATPREDFELEGVGTESAATEEPAMHGGGEPEAIEVETTEAEEPERISQDDVRDYEQMPEADRNR